MIKNFNTSFDFVSQGSNQPHLLNCFHSFNVNFLVAGIPCNIKSGLNPQW